MFRAKIKEKKCIPRALYRLLVYTQVGYEGSKNSLSGHYMHDVCFLFYIQLGYCTGLVVQIKSHSVTGSF